jgi:hypothetical protein
MFFDRWFRRPSNTSEIVFVSRIHILHGIISYRAPSIDFLSPMELSSVGGTKMTVDGSDFGAEFSSSVSILVCNQTCSQSVFVSPTSATCIAPPAPQPDYKQLAPVVSGNCAVTITIANRSGSLESNLSYVRPPMVLQSVAPQVAASGAITLIGSAFGLENPNSVARIGFTACLATLWQSWTRLLCYVPPGSGTALDVSVTIFDRTVSIYAAFSYPPPRILSVFPSSIPSVGSVITVTGLNFGTNASQIAVRANQLPCMSLRLIASNIISCFAAPGSGVNRLVSVASDGQVATVDSLNYDRPSLYRIHPALMPAASDFAVTVSGASMGFAASSFLLLNFSSDVWIRPIISRCSLLSPHISMICFVSTASFPSEKTKNGAVNSTVLVSVDSQASAALPVTILPRSSLAELYIKASAQFSPTVFAAQLLDVLSAPSSCSIFINNVSDSNANRRLLANSFPAEVFIMSRNSDSEAQEYMDHLASIWSSDPTPLQAIGILSAAFEVEVPIFVSPVPSLPSTRTAEKSVSYLDWTIPAVSAVLGSICLGTISFFAHRRYRGRSSGSSAKSSLQDTSVDSDIAGSSGAVESESEFISIDIDGKLDHAVAADCFDAASAVAICGAAPDGLCGPKSSTKKFYGVPIDDQVCLEYRGFSIPLIAATLMNFVVQMCGKETRGIFRLSVSSAELSAALSRIEVCSIMRIMCMFSKIGGLSCCRFVVLKEKTPCERPTLQLATAVLLLHCL